MREGNNSRGFLFCKSVSRKMKVKVKTNPQINNKAMFLHNSNSAFQSSSIRKFFYFNFPNST